MDISCKTPDCLEFAKIPQDLTLKQYNIAKLFDEKNNFSNVLSSDETRVMLSDDTYINANFILDQYIATQQPNVNTIDDFWQMVYETNCNLIINLCGDNNYIPEKPHEEYRKVNIETISFVDKENIQIRKINVINNTKSKIIYHITFKKWKDFDIPTEKDMKRLLMLVNTLEDKLDTNCRMIVHCRAGIGRTGTFIMIHHILKKYKNNEPVNFLDIVKEMRKARTGMVQTKKQFAFVKQFVNQNYTMKQKSQHRHSCGIKHNHNININKNKSKLSYSSEIVSKI